MTGASVQPGRGAGLSPWAGATATPLPDTLWVDELRAQADSRSGLPETVRVPPPPPWLDFHQIKLDSTPVSKWQSTLLLNITIGSIYGETTA